MSARLAPLEDWQLLLALGVLGVVSYFGVSIVLSLLAWLQPAVSIVGAVVVVGWTGLVVRRARRRREDLRERGLIAVGMQLVHNRSTTGPRGR